MKPIGRRFRPRCPALPRVHRHRTGPALRHCRQEPLAQHPPAEGRRPILANSAGLEAPLAKIDADHAIPAHCGCLFLLWCVDSGVMALPDAVGRGRPLHRMSGFMLQEMRRYGCCRRGPEATRLRRRSAPEAGPPQRGGAAAVVFEPGPGGVNLRRAWPCPRRRRRGPAPRRSCRRLTGSGPRSWLGRRPGDTRFRPPQGWRAVRRSSPRSLPP